MAIRDAATDNRERLLLTRCPLDWCNEDLTGATKTSTHFLNDHAPEDFGLSPLGEVRQTSTTPPPVGDLDADDEGGVA